MGVTYTVTFIWPSALSIDPWWDFSFQRLVVTYNFHTIFNDWR